MGVSNLVIRTDGVSVYLTNQCDWLDLPNQVIYANKHSQVRIPMIFLFGADSTCVSIEGATIDNDEIVIDVLDSDLSVITRNAKVRASLDNNVPYHVSISQPDYTFVVPGDTAYFTISCTCNQNEIVVLGGGYSSSQVYVNTIANGSVSEYVGHIYRASSSTREIDINISSSSNSDTVPVNSWYNYNLSQQMYTSSEIGNASSRIILKSIAFKGNASGLYTRNLNIYITPTDMASLPDRYTPIQESDLFYSGSYSFVSSWSSATGNGLILEPGANILLTVADRTGSYRSGLRCTTHSGKALYATTDSSPYNVSTGNNVNIATARSSIKLFVRDFIEDTPDA